MRIIADWNRVVSLLVAVTYMIAAGLIQGMEGILRATIFLVLPMAAIWYGEEMGSFLSGGGVISKFPITVATPGCLVVFVGWALLLSPVLAVVISVATK
jgi:hypothetical protein